MIEPSTTDPKLFIALIFLNLILGILNINLGNRGSGNFSLVVALIFCIIGLYTN